MVEIHAAAELEGASQLQRSDINGGDVEEGLEVLLAGENEVLGIGAETVHHMRAHHVRRIQHFLGLEARDEDPGIDRAADEVQAQVLDVVVVFVGEETEVESVLGIHLAGREPADAALGREDVEAQFHVLGLLEHALHRVLLDGADAERRFHLLVEVDDAGEKDARVLHPIFVVIVVIVLVARDRIGAVHHHAGFQPACAFEGHVQIGEGACGMARSRSQGDRQQGRRQWRPEI